jgi:hypothetical protein
MQKVRMRGTDKVRWAYHDGGNWVISEYAMVLSEVAFNALYEDVTVKPTLLEKRYGSILRGAKHGKHTNTHH